MNILLCVTGSVAATVTDKTIEALKEIGEVEVAVTANATRFIDFEFDDTPEKNALLGGAKLHEDRDEWRYWDEQNQKVLHIDLKDWADVIVVAPLTANTLGKIWAGMCDNLVTSVIRACPIDKPMVLAPAMNTDMWNNPITNSQLNDIYNRYNSLGIVEPVKKMLACGVIGIGAMAQAEDIIEEVTGATRYL